WRNYFARFSETGCLVRGSAMVKQRVIWLGFILILLALLLPAYYKRYNMEREGRGEANIRGHVDGGFFTLSQGLSEILGDPAVSNTNLLRLEYARRYRGAPIFTPTNPEPRELPNRDYFWLREWST